jgi:hypothetical protein
MHFLNVNKVVKDLRYGALDEKESSKYLIGTLFIEATAVFGGGQANDLAFHYKLLSFLVNITIIYLGIKMCYRANRESGDKDFLKRYVCLAFPIAIWVSLSVTVMVIGMSLLVYFRTMGQPIDALSKGILIPTLIVGYGFAIGKFFWIKRCILKLSKV